MKNTINSDKQLLSLGYNLNANNESYFDKLVNRYGYGEYHLVVITLIIMVLMKEITLSMVYLIFFGLSISNWNKWLSDGIVGDTQDSQVLLITYHQLINHLYHLMM